MRSKTNLSNLCDPTLRINKTTLHTNSFKLLKTFGFKLFCINMYRQRHGLATVHDSDERS